MTVDDVCDCLKNDITGLKLNMIPTYIHDIIENNVSGRVLLACDLDELKQVSIFNKILFIEFCFFFVKVISMTFGDWVLFSNWVRAKRTEEQ